MPAAGTKTTKLPSAGISPKNGTFVVFSFCAVVGSTLVRLASKGSKRLRFGAGGARGGGLPPLSLAAASAGMDESLSEVPSAHKVEGTLWTEYLLPRGGIVENAAHTPKLRMDTIVNPSKRTELDLAVNFILFPLNCLVLHLLSIVFLSEQTR